MRVPCAAAVGLLLASGVTGEICAQERQTQRLQSAPVDRSFRVTNISAVDAVMAFSIEGVSLQTPYAEIRDILTARGYEEEYQPSMRLRFLRGGHSRGAGRVTHQIEIDERNGGRYLRFMRSTTDGPVSESDSTLWSEQPLPSSADVEKLKSLKSIICGGIPDERERWRLCPPNVKDEARLAMGRSGVTLVEGLVVEVPHATPLATVIQIRRKP